MALVRREADLHSRSVAGQITKLGRAIERSGVYDHARITAALDGRLDTRDLSEEEGAAWLDAVAGRMAELTEAERTAFAGRQRPGQGVGLDAGGNLVHAEHCGGA